jgi:Rrf2 family protein
MLSESPLATHDLSAKVEYAILALIELAGVWNQKKPITVSEIATRQPIPDRYLEHIFTMLRRGGLVQSQRGAKGGYILIREPWKISVSEVINLVDGDVHNGAGRQKGKDNLITISCEREIVRDIWQEAALASQEVLSRYTIQDLCEQRDQHKQKHPMYYI